MLILPFSVINSNSVTPYNDIGVVTDNFIDKIQKEKEKKYLGRKLPLKTKQNIFPVGCWSDTGDVKVSLVGLVLNTLRKWSYS